jgi:CxxC motif-containing protein (DUF1111 family)
MNLEETWEGRYPAKDVAGRFGWKAWMPTLLRQVCDALGEDMGLTNVFHPRDVTLAQSDALGDYARGGHGALFEAGGSDPGSLAAYTRYLAPPPRPEPADAATVQGGALFDALRCSACHRAELETGPAGGVNPLSGQTIRPFTDLLLHDLGPGLADGRPEGKATGSEWRTAPLWGLGATVNESGEGLLLHDGRARSLEEAILWHGGEGERSAEAFKALAAEERAALLLYLRSL